MNNKNNFPLDFVQCFFLFPKQLPTGTALPCSVLILSMVKNQSDVENLVKNCLTPFKRTNAFRSKQIKLHA